MVKFGTYYLNSIKISTLVTIGQVATSVLAGYSFAKINFTGRDKAVPGLSGYDDGALPGRHDPSVSSCSGIWASRATRTSP